MTESSRPGHSMAMATAVSEELATPLLCPPASGTTEAAARAAPDFEQIYEENVDFVWRSLRRLGLGEAGLDDAVQDVFVVVHRRLASFEARSSMKTWLFGIAARVAHDHRRRAQRKGGLVALAPELADGAPRPDEQAERSEAVRTLDTLLAGLDEPKRMVFLLTEIEDMTAPEIAEALGVNVNTVYSRLRAARQEFELAVARRKAGHR